MIPARALFGLEDVITKKHLDNMAKMLLVTGWIVTYSYLVEAFIAWYSGDRYEMYDAARRPAVRRRTRASTGSSSSATASSSQVLWSKRMRTSALALFVIACFVQRRHVDRALHAHRHVAAARLPAVELAHLRPELGRLDHPRRDDLLLPASSSCSSCGSSRSSRSPSSRSCAHELDEERAMTAPRAPCVAARRRVRHARGAARAPARAARARLHAARRVHAVPGRRRSSSALPASLGCRGSCSARALAGGGARRTSLQWWMQRRRLPARTSAAARSTRPRRSSRSRSRPRVLRGVARRRSSRCSCSAGCRACTIRSSRSTGFERASIDRFWLGVDDARSALRRRASSGELAGSAPLRCARLGAADAVTALARAARGAAARASPACRTDADARHPGSAPRTHAQAAEAPRRTTSDPLLPQGMAMQRPPDGTAADRRAPVGRALRSVVDGRRRDGR